MKTKTLLTILAAGAGYLAYRGSQVAPTVPVTPGNLTTLIRAGWNTVAPKAMTAVVAPASSSTPAALQPTTPATTPAAQGYFGYSE